MTSVAESCLRLTQEAFSFVKRHSTTLRL